MTTSAPFTSAECRELARELVVRSNGLPDSREILRKSADILRWTADLLDAAEKGVTDEVVSDAMDIYTDTCPRAYGMAYVPSMRAALIAIAPHLALTKDKP